MLVRTKRHSRYHTDLSGFCKILCVCVFMCVGGHSVHMRLWRLKFALNVVSPESAYARDSLSQPPSPGSIDGPLPSFYTDGRDSNSGLHACTGNALLPKSSP